MFSLPLHSFCRKNKTWKQNQTKKLWQKKKTALNVSQENLIYCQENRQVCLFVSYSVVARLFLNLIPNFLYIKAMAEFAQLKVELAKSLEAQTGSQSEQMNLAQRNSELVRIELKSSFIE